MSQGLIQGSMREAPLPDIIQLVCQGGKTGCFHVTEDTKRAKIFLKGGRIVHAVTRDNLGLDALFEVALWLDGTYHFEETEVPAEATINKPNPSILMEMHKRMDEWRVLCQKIPSLDLYPYSTLLPGELPTGVGPREGKVLALLTGFYSVSELAVVLGRAPLNLAKDLYGLIMAGHVELKGVRSARRPDLPATTAETQAVVPGPTWPDVRVTAALPDLPPMPDTAALATVPAGMAPAGDPRTASRPQSGSVDPVRLAKLTHFCQRIIQTAKADLPAEHHEMLNKLMARANNQLVQGEGPDAVKNLALAVSRGAVEAGCDGELVKTLNAHLKALFAK